MPIEFIRFDTPGIYLKKTMIFIYLSHLWKCTYYQKQIIRVCINHDICLNFSMKFVGCLFLKIKPFLLLKALTHL